MYLLAGLRPPKRNFIMQLKKELRERVAQREVTCVASVIINRNIFTQKNFREIVVNLLYFQKKVRILEIICMSAFPPHTKVYKWERG